MCWAILSCSWIDPISPYNWAYTQYNGDVLYYKVQYVARKILGNLITVTLSNVIIKIANLIKAVCLIPLLSREDFKMANFNHKAFQQGSHTVFIRIKAGLIQTPGPE